MIISRGSIWTLERCGLVTTRRGPRSRLAPSRNIGHNFPVAPPLPHPEYLQHQNGDPVPDAGASQIWPHGLEGETPIDNESA